MICQKQKAQFHWLFLTKAAQKAALAIAHFSARACTFSNPEKGRFQL
jgi:hypothetical protein